MEYFWVIEIDAFCLMILSIVMFSLHKNYDRQTRQRYYMRTVLMGIISILSEVNWALIEGGFISEPRMLNYLSNAVYFITSTMSAYFWFCYVEFVLGSGFMKNRKIRVAAFIPIVFTAFAVLVSYYSGFLFFIDSSNVYHRGNYVFIHTGFCYLYTVLTSVHAFVSSLRTRDYHKSMEFRILSMFLLFPFAIGVIQVMIPEIPTISIGMTLAFLFVYIDLQNLLISIDTLSGLNNRNQVLRYLSTKIRDDYTEKSLYVFMLDVNRFKKINDTYGNVEGDKALVRCARALKAANASTSHFVGRYGGDEFIIIGELNDDKEAEEICRRISFTLDAICREDKISYDLTFSFGYASYRKDMRTIQNFIGAADQKLYEAKKKRMSSYI